MHPDQQPPNKQVVALETARLIELLGHTDRVIQEHESSARIDSKSSIVGLRLARDNAVTRVLQLTAQASELAATQAELLHAKQELERALASVERADDSQRN